MSWFRIKACHVVRQQVGAAVHVVSAGTNPKRLVHCASFGLLAAVGIVQWPRTVLQQRSTAMFGNKKKFEELP